MGEHKWKVCPWVSMVSVHAQTGRKAEYLGTEADRLAGFGGRKKG